MNPDRHAYKTWFTLAFALACCGGTLVFRQLRPVAAPAGRAEAEALRAELASLPAALEQPVPARGRLQSADANAVRALLESLAREGWRVTNHEGTPSLAANEPAAMPWTDLVRTIDRLESQPGVAISAVWIESTGSRTVRSFSRIEIVLRVHDVTSPTNPVRTPPEPGVGPGSGSSPARLRETGPGPLSARRPPAPAAIPEAGSGSRPGGASVPATLAAAAR